MNQYSDYKYLAFPVNHVLEIRLCQDSWLQIKKAALRWNKSYSWVVRYTLFRLIRRYEPGRLIVYAGNPRDDINLQNQYNMSTLNQIAWERRSGASEKHRHRLCLYGEDELFVRLVAARLGCTMTHLVRLALEKYLGSLLLGTNRFMSGCKGFVLASMLYWLGIKLFEDVEFHSHKQFNRVYSFTRYKPFDYF